MTPVFEELDPMLKEIRIQLNNLTLKKAAPKVRKAKKAKKKRQPAELPQALPNDTLGGKAGKVAYPILVGEVSNLYKTSKFRLQ